MSTTSTFAYAQVDGTQVVELPYRGGRLSMLVVLPSGAGGLPALEARLTPETNASWTSALAPGEVAVTLPSFRVEDRTDLGTALVELGMGRAFDPALADFSPMTGEADLCVSRVVHEAFVEVTEEGTEAAAATAVLMTECCAVPTLAFVADRPFLFLVRDRVTGAILFVGRLADPSSAAA